ncbi:TAXI family TRAP transporter solute-binding subunit [Streptomyces phyllanthi]|uniref:TAXI family TRAP transporter solute-binding subunit n=1 Tax=Streptomyces phyllanthi TaxID=1803180 RepID=A0A5N8WED9_9ACTN|nr:TAXI family TRAP transporter solute-binding subunit [Streptomyces phyllanthi]MPY44545.1 TAXI family TRAP transporter solute-binding subunit [Streptomyces phyllanthi]
MFQPNPRFGAHRALLASTAALVVLGLLAWWLWPREEPPTGNITISTGPTSGVYQQYGKRLRDAMAKNMPGLKVELETSDGSQQNVARVADGEADFAIAAADAVETYRTVDKAGFDRLRGLVRLYDDYVQLVVPHSSGIETVKDLQGKRVGVGPKRSGVRLIAERVLRAAELDPEKDIKPQNDTIRTAPDRLRKGKIDAFFWSGGLPTRGLQELAKVYGFRFIPISSEVVDELHGQGEAFRYYRSALMPGDAYWSVQRGASVQTLTVANLLITRADMDPRLVEWLTRTVIRNRDTIGSDVHAAQLVDLRTAIYTDPLPLHKGAGRYYRSVKP